ncbi:MAG: helical backbone metal receptor, partial [Bacteroidota bacterium]
MAIVLHDQIGNEISLTAPAVKIISLVPSQTELLHALGMDAEVIGITKFCVHPEKWFRTKQRIGGTKQINIEAILSLKPDLVIANKEENVKEQIEALRLHVPVYTSCISNLEEAVQMIQDVATLTGKSKNGTQLAEEIANRFNTLSFH